jgi:hypothetical protein
MWTREGFASKNDRSTDVTTKVVVAPPDFAIMGALAGQLAGQRRADNSLERQIAQV